MLGRDLGRAGFGDDFVRQHRRREIHHRSRRAALRIHRSVAYRVPLESPQVEKVTLTMRNLLDTFLNIEVFTFIGLLLWLYFKQFEPEDSKDPKT